MFRRFSKIFFLFSLIFISVEMISAQTDRNNGLSKMDLPEGMKENLAKQRLKAEEKEYQELIKRSEEAFQISEELSKSYEENKKFSNEDLKKLEKLEKVVKRIRRDLGAEDEDEDENASKPSTFISTLNSIKEKSSSLLSELKKTSRYSISVVAVESSNTIFKLVRFLRFSKN